MFTIGIDPHKGTHTAAVLDGTETVVDEFRLVADRHQRDRLLSFATRFEPRTWAIEGAGGLGLLLAQQLVAAGETVLDVPPSLSARVRLLDSTRTDKTGSHDARAAAVVAMRHSRLRRVTPVDHTAVLPVARPAVPAHTGRRLRAPVSPAGGADSAGHPSARARRDRAQAHRRRPCRRCPPIRQPARRAQRADR